MTILCFFSGIKCTMQLKRLLNKTKYLAAPTWCWVGSISYRIKKLSISQKAYFTTLHEWYNSCILSSCHNNYFHWILIRDHEKNFTVSSLLVYYFWFITWAWLSNWERHNQVNWYRYWETVVWLQAIIAMMLKTWITIVFEVLWKTPCTQHSLCVAFLRIWIILLQKVEKKFLTFWLLDSNVWSTVAMTQPVLGWTAPFLTHLPFLSRALARSSCWRRKSSSRARTSTLMRVWTSMWASPTLDGPPMGHHLTSTAILTHQERRTGSQVGFSLDIHTLMIKNNNF